jgi:predicted transglutaminase-like cysteine proteinase
MITRIVRPLIASAAAALAQSVLMAPLSAQAFPLAAAGSLSLSKSEAILGGRSALEAIRAAQEGRPLAPRAPLTPASYAAPIHYAPFIQRARTDAEGVVSGRPDVFGTVALKVGHTPLDSKWRRVEHVALDSGQIRFAHALSAMDDTEKLEAVNRYVNHRVSFVDDSVRFGRSDVWSAAATTLRVGRGDCEDYAIAKLQLLRAAGIADRDLYLTIVKDLVRRADHAVLVVRAVGHMYVLDNGTDALLDSEDVADYRPVLTFAANGEWIHGYRRQAPSVEIASAAIAAPVELASIAPQRSRSASLLAFNAGFSR